MKKYIMIVVLIFCLFLTKTSYTVFLNEQGLADPTPVHITKTMSFSDSNKHLIPTTAVQGIDDVYEYQIITTYEIDDDSSVSLEDFSFYLNDETLQNDLFTVDFNIVTRYTVNTMSLMSMDFNDTVIVEITITFNESLNDETLQVLINQDVDFSYTVLAN